MEDPFKNQASSVTSPASEGEVVSFTNIQGGVFYPIRITMILASGAT